MASGRIKKITASGLKPVIRIVNRNNSEAIMFLDAKKPLVVENKPTNASAKVGSPTSGVIKTLSSEPSHRKTGVTPIAMLWKKCENEKSLAVKSSGNTSGWCMILIISVAMPAMISADTIESGNLGKLLITKRRCGCKNTKIIQKAAK